MATGQNTVVIPKLIKTITENENMTVLYTNTLSFHHKWTYASFDNTAYK